VCCAALRCAAPLSDATRPRSLLAAWFAAALKGLQQVRAAERSLRALRSTLLLPSLKHATHDQSFVAGLKVKGSGGNETTLSYQNQDAS